MWIKTTTKLLLHSRQPRQLFLLCGVGFFVFFFSSSTTVMVQKFNEPSADIQFCSVNEQEKIVTSSLEELFLKCVQSDIFSIEWQTISFLIPLRFIDPEKQLLNELCPLQLKLQHPVTETNAVFRHSCEIPVRVLLPCKLARGSAASSEEASGSGWWRSNRNAAFVWWHYNTITFHSTATILTSEGCNWFMNTRIIRDVLWFWGMSKRYSRSTKCIWFCLMNKRQQKKLQLVTSAASSANDPVAMRQGEPQLAAAAWFDPDPMQKACSCQMTQSKWVWVFTGPAQDLFMFHLLGCHQE